MRRRMRSEEFIYGKTKKDTEFGQELITQNTKELSKKKNVDVGTLANNPRPKYEIYPGE